MNGPGGCRGGGGGGGDGLGLRGGARARGGLRDSSTRLGSLTQRAIAAIEYEVEPVASSLRIVLQSELVANEELPAQSKDPRTAAILESPLVGEEHSSNDTKAMLVHRTR